MAVRSMRPSVIPAPSAPGREDHVSEQLPNPALLMRLALAYRSSMVLFAATELDVFTALANGRCTADGAGPRVQARSPSRCGCCSRPAWPKALSPRKATLLATRRPPTRFSCAVGMPTVGMASSTPRTSTRRGRGLRISCGPGVRQSSPRASWGTTRRRPAPSSLRCTSGRGG